jgi:hypothetical protein
MAINMHGLVGGAKGDILLFVLLGAVSAAEDKRGYSTFLRCSATRRREWQAVEAIHEKQNVPLFLSAALHSLKVLFVSETKITDQGLKRLRAALPNCDIVRD